MNLIQAIILAIIQGITEWLPISSSGHLVIAQHFFSLNENVSYDIMLHFASLIAIVLVFRKDIFQYFIKNLGLLIIGTLPIVIVGFFIKDYIDSIFSNIILVGFMLIFTGILLYFSDKILIKTKLNPKSSLTIGIFQAIAIMPGVSRSGSTISSALMMGIKKEEAVKFAFMLAIPAIFGAMILNIKEVSTAIESSMIIGFFLTIIISYFCLTWLIKLINKNKFKYFSYYCFLIGLIIIIGGIL